MKSFLQRTLAVAGLSVPALAAVPFDIPTTSMDDVKTVYALDVFKNEMSTVNLLVDTGSVLQADIGFAGDTTQFLNPAGAGPYVRGYTANVGLLIPLNSAWAVRDLSTFDSLTFEFSSNGAINDQLSVSFGSTKYIDSLANAGLVYEMSKVKTRSDTITRPKLEFAHDWVGITFYRAELVRPTWYADAEKGYPQRWAEPMAAFPTLDSVLANVKNIQISPKTSYTGAGWNFTTNTSCKSCAKAYTPIKILTLRFRNILIWLNGEPAPLKLGVGNGREIGVRDVAKGVRYAGLSWSRGTLSLDNASQWSRVQILSLDGKAIASFNASAAHPLDLVNGTYFASLTDLQGRVVTQSFQVIR